MLVYDGKQFSLNEYNKITSTMLTALSNCKLQVCVFLKKYEKEQMVVKEYSADLIEYVVSCFDK